MIDLDLSKEIWVTSDTHAFHTNICRGVSGWKDKDGKLDVNRTRDFKDLKEMNDVMARNINDVVGQEDILLHLGDWSFGGFDKIEDFRKRIICQNVYLFLGNHDHHIGKDKDGVRSLFSGVYEEDMITIDGQLIILKHYPIASWFDLSKGTIMLHGHLHSNNRDKFTGKGKTMDVGIDGHPEFRPYHLKREIIPLMNKRPIASSIDSDRHGKTIKH